MERQRPGDAGQQLQLQVIDAVALVSERNDQDADFAASEATKTAYADALIASAFANASADKSIRSQRINARNAYAIIRDSLSTPTACM